MGVEGLTDPERHEPYKGDEKATEGIAVPDPQKPLIPLDEGVAGQDAANEEKRQAELNAQRDEHNRRTAGGDPQE